MGATPLSARPYGSKSTQAGELRQACREMPFNVACAANLSASVGCVALSKAVTAMVSALRCTSTSTPIAA